MVGSHRKPVFTEVWVVWEQGMVDYYDNTGGLLQSTFGIDLKIPAM